VPVTQALFFTVDLMLSYALTADEVASDFAHIFLALSAYPTSSVEQDSEFEPEIG
jgi:hypothetical protein